MFTNSKLAKSIRLAMAVGAASTAMVASNSALAQEAEADSSVEKIEVTGSRIKRTDMENATPIAIITAADLKATGRFTVADALRNSTANQFGSFNQRSGSSAQSQATISLLGAGSDRTLVLLNGMRLPGSPSLGGTAVNLNMIPTAAVERIDIMKDGGSAVYGSDAIAGVVNIILKDDYEGLTVSGGVTKSDAEGADSSEISIVGGISNDKGNITFAFEHQESDPVFDGDRPYTAARMEDLNGDGVITRAVETDGISNFGATIVNPITGQLEASPQCADLTANVFGFVGELAESAGGTSCGFAYANVSANMASTSRNSMLITADYEVADDMEFFTRLMAINNKSFGRYAPPAAFFPLIPANTAHNPYDEDTFGRFRWYQLGNRDNNVTDTTQDYIAGLRGTAGDTIDWEIYYHYNYADNKSVGNTYLSFSGLIANLYYDTAFDSEEGLAALGATTLNNDTNRFEQFYAGASFEAGELSGGAISHYIGAERFDINYKSTVDKQSEGGWVGGSAGNSSGATREITAFFYEAMMPVTDELEVNLAVRYDDYSDFGSEVSPKVSVSYRPMDDILIRASYGQGFRAPTLSELTQADAFSATDATDFVLCRDIGVADADCPGEQFNDTIQSNKELQPETSDMFNVGVVWDAMENMSVKADYFVLSVDDVIQSITVQDLIYRELAGKGQSFNDKIFIDRLPLTADQIAAGRTVGGINEVFSGAENGPGFEIEGLDIQLTYFLETEYGEFRVNWQNSYFLAYESSSYVGGPVQDSAGWGLQPDYATQLTLSYGLGDHSVSWNIDHKASTYESETVDVRPDDTYLVPSGDLTSFTIHNATYTFDGGDYGVYSLGVLNVFDRGPVLDSLGTYPRDHFDVYTPGHIGRQFRANFVWSF